jgi:hypothetical protein
VKDIISPKRNCLAADSTILDEWSATLPLPDYVRVVRQLSRMLVGSFGLAAGLLIHLEAAQRLASGRLPTGTMM